MSNAVFVKTSPMYDQDIISCYSEDPTLREKPYAEQHAVLISRGFGWANGWSKYLSKLGGYTVHEIIVNAEVLQKQWAHEHGCKYNRDTWLADIVTAQLCELKPDIWFAHDFSNINSADRKRIRALIPETRLVIGWDGAACNSAALFEGCDLIMSCAEFVSDYYAQCGFLSYTFNHCLDPEILSQVRVREPLYDLSFIGSIYLRDGGHVSRLKFAGELARHVDIDFWISSLLPENRWHYFRQQFKRLKHGKIDEFNWVRRIAARNRGEVFGRDMLQLLADSRMTINSHIDAAGAKAGNMRLFEATGVGTCLITDWKENIGDFFLPDEEVVTYRSVSECVDKIRMLQKDEALRTRIARAGQKRTLEEHSFEKRIKGFSDYIRQIGW